MKLIFGSRHFGKLEQALAAARPRLRRFWASDLIGRRADEGSELAWNGESRTALDLECEAILRDSIVPACPDLTIYSEDGGLIHHGTSNLACLMDPLDATHNAHGGYPAFTCNVALHNGERYIFAWVYDVSRDVTYSAAADGGAFVHTGVLARKLTTGDGQEIDRAALAIMRARSSPSEEFVVSLFRRAGKIRLSSCSSLDLCLIASTSLNGFVDLSSPGHSRSCDIAASALILREAGGLVLDADGRSRQIAPPSDFALSDRAPLIAADSRRTADEILASWRNFERNEDASRPNQAQA